MAKCVVVGSCVCFVAHDIGFCLGGKLSKDLRTIDGQRNENPCEEDKCVGEEEREKKRACQKRTWLLFLYKCAIRNEEMLRRYKLPTNRWFSGTVTEKLHVRKAERSIVRASKGMECQTPLEMSPRNFRSQKALLFSRPKAQQHPTQSLEDTTIPIRLRLGDAIKSLWLTSAQGLLVHVDFYSKCFFRTWYGIKAPSKHPETIKHTVRQVSDHTDYAI